MPTPLVGYGEGCRSVEHYAFLNTNDTHRRKQNRRYRHNAPDEEPRALAAPCCGHGPFRQLVVLNYLVSKVDCV
jgi:hypothetical protein